MTTTISISRENMIDALERMLPMAAKYDADAKKAHEAEERATLAAFRERAKEAAKWDYQTAKEHDFELKYRPDGNTRYSWWGPTCPRSQVARIEAALRVVRVSQQKSYNLDARGKHSTLYDLLTWDPNAPKDDLCG
jgi:hypothetical protein